MWAHTQNISQYKASGHFDKFVFQNWFSLQRHKSVNHLGTQKLLPFLTPEYVSSYYPE